MIIYNTLKVPVSVMLDDRTIVIDADSEFDERIPSDEYFFRVHKLDRKGRPSLQRYESGGRHSSGTTFLCLATSALLTIRKETKVYLRQERSTLVDISAEHYKAESFDILIENGEMEKRRDGYLDESVREKMIRSFKINLVAGIIGHLLLIGGCAFILGMLFKVVDLQALTESDIWDFVPFIIFPVVSAIMIFWDIHQSQNAEIFQDIPILPEKSEYDYF